MVGAGTAALVFGLWLGGIWPQSQVADLLTVDALTAWGLPISRMCVDLSAVGTIGMLTAGILLPRGGGALGDAARRCLRSATWLAVVWGVSMAALLMLTWSDITALPVSQMPITQVLTGENTSYPEAVPYLFGAVLALIIAAAAAAVQTTRGVVITLVLAGYNLLPLTTQGHAEHSPIIAYGLTIHVIALSLWVGGLTGLLVHARTARELLTVAVPRFSTLALTCFIGVGASGVVMAWVNLVEPAELWRSRYGLLVLCKIAALTALGVFGWWHRRRTVRAVSGERGQRAFIQLAAAEVIIMAATIALGVVLGRSATPATINDRLTGGHPAASAPFPERAAAAKLTLM
jgi:putative copper resistance protein D